MADEIAQKVGIFTDSDYRIKAGILYVLLQRLQTAIPICQRAGCLNSVGAFKGGARNHGQAPDGYADRPEIGSKNALCEEGPTADPLIYSSHYYYLELNTARMLHDLTSGAISRNGD